MIRSLFSMFDPSSYTLGTAWAILLILAINKNANTKKPNSTELVKNHAVASIAQNFSFSLERAKKTTVRMLVSVFLLILTLNLISLYSYTFSATRQIIPVVRISIPIWLRINMLHATKRAKRMVSHLTPQGTPAPLMNFMVIIEISRNIIRPITLSVRLVANMVAGHLLLSLLGRRILISKRTAAFAAGIVLTPLELAVSFIQSYVFSTLLMLYVKEVL